MDDVFITLDYCIGFGERNEDLINNNYSGYGNGNSDDDSDGYSLWNYTGTG